MSEIEFAAVGMSRVRMPFYRKSDGEKTAIQSSVEAFSQPYFTVTHTVSSSYQRELKILRNMLQFFILFFINIVSVTSKFGSTTKFLFDIYKFL
jgi:hypothetical protein